MFEESTGIEDTKLKSQVHLFPNPTKGIIEIRLDKGLGDDLQKTTVTNILGKRVYESVAKVENGHSKIDLSANSPGSYLVTFYFKSGEKVSYTILLSK